MPLMAALLFRAFTSAITIIRAISLGGDTDTMACIAGNIAAATMPIPEDVALACYDKLPQELREIFNTWNRKEQ